jgi:glycosyltransferase involved in cell wall biosynthesis
MNTQDQPIRVMRIIARLNVGGPALHCLALSSGLNRYGFTTTLVTGSPESDEADYEKIHGTSTEGFRMVRLSRMRRVPGLSDALTLFDLVRIMRRERPMIVHTHTAKAGALGRTAACLAGVPVVVHTFHGHVLSGYFSPWKNFLVRWIERSLAWRTTAIVTLSPSLRDELSQKFHVAPASKFSIIPLGRDLSEFIRASDFKGKLRRELGLTSPGILLVGTIGRLVPIKDQSTMLRAFAAMKGSNASRAHLVIAGDGELRASLEEEAAALGIAERVHFLGWRSDLPAIYADLDLFALSSRNEGTPLSIIEAFAAGVPVVSTRVGGVADLFSGGGVGNLVPPQDPAALTRAMEELLENPDIRRKCSEAARVAGSKFTLENLFEGIAELYKSLLRRKAG